MNLVNYTKNFSLIKSYIALGIILSKSGDGKIFKQIYKGTSIKQVMNKCKKLEQDIVDLRVFVNDNNHRSEIKNYEDYLKGKLFSTGNPTLPDDLSDQTKYFKCNKSTLLNSPRSIIGRILTEKVYNSQVEDYNSDIDHYDEEYNYKLSKDFSYNNFLKHCSAKYDNGKLCAWCDDKHDPFSGNWLQWKVFERNNVCYIPIDIFNFI